MQPGGTILGAKRVDYTDTRDERVVHVEVKLVEGLLQFRVIADLRTDRVHFACRCQDEVLMRRNRQEQVWRISTAGSGERA